MTVLVTGGSGFFGELLVRRLLADGHRVVNVDLQPDPNAHPRLASVRADLRHPAVAARLFADHRPAAVVHAAALLAHAVADPAVLWQANVDATRHLADAARRHGCRHFVFISTNCLWGRDLGRPVREDDPPAPVEVYGRSKAAAEELLTGYQADLRVVVLRPPTIIDAGRLGLLAILFDFIREGRRVWVVGDGGNRYQFVYAPDLADAVARGLGYDGSGTFHVGSDGVKPLRAVYDAVIAEAGTGARTASLPKAPTLAALRALYWAGLSPLGPYQYRMIAANFEFDTTRAKALLGWRPTLTNEQMLTRAYRYYADRYDDIRRRTRVSAHKRSAPMGAIRLLKWVS